MRVHTDTSFLDGGQRGPSDTEVLALAQKGKQELWRKSGNTCDAAERRPKIERSRIRSFWIQIYGVERVLRRP